MSSIEIPIGKNKFAIIDKEDLELVMRHSWCYHVNSSGLNEYARGSRSTDPLSMHVYITGCPIGMVVDHKNGNGLDNRKNNLRVCTQAQNCKNRRRHIVKNKYKGVYPSGNGKKWTAEISKNGKTIRLGTFDREIDAADAYNKKAKETHGEFASLNPMVSFEVMF